MDLETTRLLKRGVPLYTALSAALLVLTLAAILRFGAEIFVPLALAILLSFVLAPAVRGLQRTGLPQGLAVVLTVLAAFAATVGLLVLIGTQLASLGADLPRYQGTIRDKIGAIGGVTSTGGALSRAIEAIEQIGHEVGAAVGSRSPQAAEAPRDEGGAARPIPVILESGGGLIGNLGTYVSPLLHPLATTGIVLVLVLFVLASREDLRNRFVRLLGTDDIQHTTAVIDDATRRLSKLFLMQLAINAAFGTMVAIGLWFIGIPSALLWGVFAAILRFVPYVGAIAATVPPLALAIAVDPGWSMLAWTAILFVVLEGALGQVLEPLLFGHSTGLSPLAIILSATVWTFLWGPIGLVLATPLTVCLVVLGRHVGGLSFVDIMLGDRPALSPPQIFYQRVLAGDPSEAVFQAKQFLRGRALSTYYDEVALEALRLAHEDVARGRLTRERQDVMRRATGALIQDLEGVTDPRPRGGQVGAEAAAAVIAAGPDRDAAVRVLVRDDLAPDWRADVTVACFARPGTVDEVVARMLAQVLTKHGIGARAHSIATGRTEASCEVATENPGVKLVCLSYVEPLSTLHLRHAVRAARRNFPGARVLIGIWRERDAASARTLGRAARADAVVPTIGAALAYAIGLATGDAAAPRSIGRPGERPEIAPPRRLASAA